MAVAFDPAQPPGTQLLSLGDDRIREVNRNLAILFGGTGVTVQQFGVPFSFFDAAAQTAGRLSVITPVNDGEIVPKGYVDSKILFFDVTGTDNYSAATPALTAYQTGAIYLVHNTDQPNTGPITFALGGLGPLITTLADGTTQLAAAEFPTGMVLALEYDGTRLRVINFTPSSFATQAYANSIVNPASITHMAVATVLITGAPANVIQATVTIPNDGGVYQILADYCCFGNIAAGPHPNARTLAWVSDGTAAWASGGDRTPTTTPFDLVLSGAGVSPVTYNFTANPTVTVTLQAVTEESGTVNAVQASGLAGAPTSYLVTTLIRTH